MPHTMPQQIPLSVKLIPLTQGEFAIVDSEDYDYLSQWKWYCSNGYAVRVEYTKKDRVAILMHREVNVTPDNLYTDHINQNRLDNRKSNLRSCTNKQNQRNKAPILGKTSIFKGVSLKKRKNKNNTTSYSWLALVYRKKKQMRKCFPHTPEGEILAAKWYDRMAKKHYGEFARLNANHFPELLKGHDIGEIGMKTLSNTTANMAQDNVSDLKVWGKSDMWRLICKASSQEEGWMKSTKAMQIYDSGCLVQVTTQQGDNIAEAVTFVPGVKIKENLNEEGGMIVVSRELVPG